MGSSSEHDEKTANVAPSEVKTMALLEKRMTAKTYHALCVLAAVLALPIAPVSAQPEPPDTPAPAAKTEPPAEPPDDAPAEDEPTAPPQTASEITPGSDEPLMVAVDPDPPPPPGPPPPPEPEEDDHPPGWVPHDHDRGTRGEDGAGPRFSFGAAFTEDIEQGYYGRFDTEEFEYSGPGRTGQVLGLQLGLEGWGSADGGGGGVPMTFYGGFRQPLGRLHGTALFSTMGLGWYWALYDDVHDDGGFGIFAPLAAANIGLDFDGVRVLTDLRAAYRWQWGAPDHYQVLAGLSLSINSDY